MNWRTANRRRARAAWSAWPRWLKVFAIGEAKITVTGTWPSLQPRFPDAKAAGLIGLGVIVLPDGTRVPVTSTSVSPVVQGAAAALRGDA